MTTSDRLGILLIIVLLFGAGLGGMIGHEIGDRSGYGRGWSEGLETALHPYHGLVEINYSDGRHSSFAIERNRVCVEKLGNITDICFTRNIGWYYDGGKQ
jgi:hypothetical protein